MSNFQESTKKIYIKLEFGGMKIEKMKKNSTFKITNFNLIYDATQNICKKFNQNTLFIFLCSRKSVFIVL